MLKLCFVVYVIVNFGCWAVDTNDLNFNMMKWIRKDTTSSSSTAQTTDSTLLTEKPTPSPQNSLIFRSDVRNHFVNLSFNSSYDYDDILWPSASETNKTLTNITNWLLSGSVSDHLPISTVNESIRLLLLNFSESYMNNSSYHPLSVNLSTSQSIVITLSVNDTWMLSNETFNITDKQKGRFIDDPEVVKHNANFSCGLSNVSVTSKVSKIKGGDEAPQHSLPWQVAILYNNSLLCGGTLIDAKHVLTAAHCVFKRELSLFSLIFGAHVVTDIEPSQVQMNATDVIIHPFYEPETLSHDVAVMSMGRLLSFSKPIRSICLPEVEASPGDQCIVSGWGETDTQRMSRILRQVAVPIVWTSVCNDSAHYSGSVDKTMICAGYDTGGKDHCYGDSGGPLSCFDSSRSRWVISGVVSWADGCAVRSKPGVYSNVIYALEWIQMVINQEHEL